MAETVRQFLTDMYHLISSSTPTVPLHGDDLERSLRVMNRLLNSYAATGLMQPIAQTVSIPLLTGQEYVVCGPATFLPTPDITLGRLSQWDSAWLDLDGVQYPLINQSRDEFLAAFLYDPLNGLPRMLITYPDTDVVRLRLYPAPSQFFQFNIRGKFQFFNLTSNDTMAILPDYYARYLQFAVARDVALYKGRAAAWTPMLEQIYNAAKDIMEAASEVNLSIVGEKESLLNGAWRVRAGI